MTSFNDFGLAEPITSRTCHEQYTTPTPIQADAIPLVLAGRDLVGIAQTGTGKTAAFALPILNRLAANRKPLEKKSPRVLVLSPTRELSGQILDSFRTYGRHLRLQSALVIGGVPMGRQVRALMNGLDVLVATPGPPARPRAARTPCASIMSTCWCSTKPTACSTWASSTTSARSSRSSRRSARRCCSPPPCRARSPSLRSRCCAIRRASPSRRLPPRQERVEQRVIMVDKPAKSALLIEVLRGEVHRADARVHPHQARRRQGGEKPASRRHFGRSDPRQQVAEPARARARRVPRRQAEGAGRDRHRGARHRRRRHQPRHQLRPAEHSGELRAPHRPHGARRRSGHRDLVLRQRRDRVPARHREADPVEAAGDRAAQRARATTCGRHNNGRSRTAAAATATAATASSSGAMAAATAIRAATSTPIRGVASKPITASRSATAGRRARSRTMAENRHAPGEQSPDNIATVAFMRNEPRRAPRGW